MPVTVRDISDFVEGWAPKEIAWERDNVGLQVGDPEARVNGILVALDVTEEVVREARRKRLNLIVSHHPLLFRPLRSVTEDTAIGRSVRALVEGRVNLFSAHTNLDYTRGGTSFALAAALGLRNTGFLRTPYTIQKKIVTFVPEEHLESVRNAMAEAGAGIIGNYDRCSFGTVGTGTFRGNERSSPVLGHRGTLEKVREVRLEMVCPAWRTRSVTEALHRAHPYEEVAYDVYPTETISSEYGEGVIGELPRPVTLRQFLPTVKRALRSGGLRCAGDLDCTVSKVAVCGGSGSSLVDAAVRRGADVLVTADVRYHSFQDAAGRIAVIDAGHFETEFPVVAALVARLKNEIRRRGAHVPVQPASTRTNPIVYV